MTSTPQLHLFTAFLAAAAFAVQLCQGSAATNTSEDGSSGDGQLATAAKLDVMAPQVPDWLTGAESMMGRALPSFLGFLEGNPGFLALSDTSVLLAPPKEDSKECHIGIGFGKAVGQAFKLTLEPSRHRILVSFQKEEKHESHDKKNGDRRSFRSVQSTNSVELPKNCIVNTAVLLAHLGGYLYEEEMDGSGRGLVVLPSSLLLQEHVEAGLLPASIVDTVLEGNQQQLGELTSKQLCLAAGFSVEQCQKLGDTKPTIDGLVSLENPEAVPIPQYSASLRLLD